MDGELIAAVLPGTTSEVSEVMKVCHHHCIPVVARGGGSSLVGGSVPLGGGIVLSLERMSGIEIDTDNVCAVAEAGAITGRIQEEAALHHLMYPPDPASAS
ncbi:MAG: FAD-binding protein, partial [Chloroflexi bacterium]